MAQPEITQLKNGRDMLYLAVCALRDQIPETAVMQDMDLSAVCDLSLQQRLSAITLYSVEKWLGTIDGEVRSRWRASKKRAVFKNLMLDMERAKLIAFMEERGIWYMPLKGCVLQSWYPQPGMRQMCDNDILFDPEHREEIKAFMLSSGFTYTQEAASVHEVYSKDPGCVFEMHLRLFGYTAQPAWREYYENVKDRLIPEENTRCGYHFTDEDMYVYMTVHGCKHYNLTGHGLRNLLDVCLFLEKKPDLRWDYIEAELEKLGLREHEAAVRSLAQKIYALADPMDSDTLTDAEREIFENCLISGAYGSRQLRAANAIRRNSGKTVSWKDRASYLLHRLIPDRELLEMHYPVVKKHKILIPFCVLHRFFKSAMRPKRLFAEIKAVWKTRK